MGRVVEGGGEVVGNDEGVRPVLGLDKEVRGVG